ncbi:MAG: siderophore-interacting protein [Rothia mucilaginosa]|nr:siderophore-interacting protein [Rothia mucilaginosa]
MRERIKRRRVRTHGDNAYGIFTLAVSRVERLTPSYVRVSLTGPSLRYAVNPVALGGLNTDAHVVEGQDTTRSEGELGSYRGVLDGYVKLLVPPAVEHDEYGRITRLNPEPVHIDLTDTWRQDWFALPDTERGWMRTYTLRASRLHEPDAALRKVIEALPAMPLIPAGVSLPAAPGIDSALPEIDLDFVCHTEVSSDGVECMGPGATWASLAERGDRVSILAPLAGQPLWASWSSGGAGRIILAVDETAVPAALSILANYAAGEQKPAEIQLIAEVPHVTDSLTMLWDGPYPHLPALSELPNLTVNWCAREDTPRGEALTAGLRKALGLGAWNSKGASITAEPSPDCDDETEIVWTLADDENPQIYVFIAGESSMVKGLRRICVQEASISKNDVSFMGYWKTGRTES